MSSHIYKQLRDLGTPSGEADSLARLADRISEVKPRGMSDATKRRMLAEIPVTYRPHHPVRWSMAGSFAVIALLVFAAQSALPGSWLYRIRRGSEEVRTLVQPSYTENIAEERKIEVEQLEKQETVAPQVLEEAEKRAEDAFKRTEEYRRRSNGTQSDQDTETQEKLNSFEAWRRLRRNRYNNFSGEQTNDWGNRYNN